MVKNTSEIFQTKNFYLINFLYKNILIEFPVLKLVSMMMMM